MSDDGWSVCLCVRVCFFVISSHKSFVCILIPLYISTASFSLIDDRLR
jgi:hypothetical protein